MMKTFCLIIVGLILGSLTYGQGRVIYNNSMKNGESPFGIWDNEGSGYGFLPNGNSYLETKSKSWTWVYMVHSDVRNLANENFIIESEVKLLNSNKEWWQGFGLMWNVSNADFNDGQIFWLRQSGGYEYNQIINGAMSPTKGWADHPAIKPGVATNKISIKRIGSKVSILVNDQLVEIIDHVAPKGNRMGFISGGMAKFEILNLKVTLLDRNLTENPDQLPENRQVISINGNRAHDLLIPWKDQYTSFEFTGTTLRYSTNYATGVFNTCSFGHWPLADVDFILESNIKIETSGSNDYVGILFGKSIGTYEDINIFQFNNQNKYSYSTKPNGEAWRSPTGTVYSSALKKGEFNRITLDKKGNLVTLSINGTEVDQVDIISASGTELGLVCAGTTSIEVSEFKLNIKEKVEPKKIQEQTITQTVVQSNTVKSDVDFNIPFGQIKRPDAIAVIIGNRDYANTKPVEFAINDAQTMKNYLITTLGFQEGNILYVENATKGQFEMFFGTDTNEKGRLFNTIVPGLSDVFIFYSGHGAPGLNDQKGYFVPVECDPNYVEISGYSSDVFYKNLGKLPAKSVTVALDACFSGATIFKNISPIVIKAQAATKVENIVVLGSSTGAEVSSWYNEKGHGLFTYFFLKSLQDKTTTDKNGDGEISLLEIHQTISDNARGVPYWARRLHGVEQHPTIEGMNTGYIMMK